MILWEYLVSKMERHANRVAFDGCGLKYADILRFGKVRSEKKRFCICAAETREKLAVKILECIAAGDVAVPVAKEYGANGAERIKRAVAETAESPDELAFVMFTSGTSGAPKGVMLTNENVCENLGMIAQYFCLNGCERMCIARPIAHVAVIVGELLYALCNGLTLCFYEEAFMPKRLAACLRATNADVFCATPTLYGALAKECANGKIPLKAGVTSGEPLAQKTALFMREAFPQTEFYNVYGLTEHSPRVSALLPCEFGAAEGSVGKPLAGVQTKIQSGELLVKSRCVMKGYLDDKEGTRLKTENGWLHTGDGAHFDENGYLYIDGRKDGMMIRAGINIYPEQIENAAKECCGVDDCAVHCEDGEYGKLICLKYAGSAEPKEVRRFLSAILDYNVMPNKIERTREFTKTPSGKKVRQ